MTKDQKKIAFDIVDRGVSRLKKWVKVYDEKPTKKGYRNFLNRIMKGDKNPGNRIPDGLLKEFHADLPFIINIKFKKVLELGNKSAEEAILEEYILLAVKNLKKWCSSLKFKKIGLTKEDMLQEASLQIIEAIYTFSSEKNVQFSSYVYAALNNKFYNIINQSSLLSRIATTDIDLMNKFTKRQNYSEKYTFDYIVADLGFSEKEKENLKCLFVSVSKESDMNCCDSLTNSFGNYTQYKSRTYKDPINVYLENTYVKSVLDRAGLTNLERELIQLSMDAERGWLTKFAKNHINPKTKKPYSKTIIPVYLQKAKEKVARIIEQKIA